MVWCVYTYWEALETSMLIGVLNSLAPCHNNSKQSKHIPIMAACRQQFYDQHSHSRTYTAKNLDTVLDLGEEA
jgi:hypothetical protein